MSAPQIEDDLIRDLQALDAVYPAEVEPPAQADDAIRAAARRAVRAKPGGEAFWWPRTPPLAAAAVLVLTVSIAFLAMDDPIVQDLQREPDVPAAKLDFRVAPSAAEPAAVADAPAKVAPPEPAAQAARVVSPPKEAQAALRADANVSAREESVAKAANRLERRASVGAPPPPPQASAPVVEAVATPPQAPAPPASPAPVGAVAPPSASATPTRASEPARAPAAPSEVGVRGLDANEIILAPKNDPRLKAFAKKETYIASPEKAAELVAEAKVAGVQPKPDSPADASAAVARTVAVASPPPPPAPVILASPAPPVAPAAAPPVLTKNPPAALLQDAQSMPQLWLKRIQLLKSEGKVKEAEEELAKFRKRYPDYPLPEDLKSKEAAPQK